MTEEQIDKLNNALQCDKVLAHTLRDRELFYTSHYSACCVITNRVRMHMEAILEENNG